MYGSSSAISRPISHSFLDDDIIEEMASEEESHWWYVGLRDLLKRTLQKPRFALNSAPTVLDAGCGTGANLQLLHQVLAPGHLEGFDAHPHSAQIATRKCPSADVHLGDIREPTLHADAYDLVISCDVLSLVGYNSCRGGLQHIVDRMKPGALFILHVPAYKWLFSEHDVAVGHVERYGLREIKSLLTSLGLKLELATYRMSLLFPIVVAYRSLSRPPESPLNRPLRSDLGRGASLGAPLLRRILTSENRLTLRGVPWPFGSSIYAVARR